jgi:hypothetical protein
MLRSTMGERPEEPPMNLKRTAMIVLIGGAVLAWLAGAATSTRVALPPIVVHSEPIEARGADLANEIARLHERLRPTATPRQPGRNLFTFSAARAAVAPTIVTPARPALVEAPARPAQPALKLAGIAEDMGADGPVRTAIISGEGQLFMVTVGEQVTSRYKVAKISADVVELLDLSDQSVRRLALR